jgi:dihydrofolate reductase
LRVTLVAAVAQNGVIGARNRLPWHLPADLKHFKAVTMGRPIVMGRLTWESIGRPLPGRRNLVVTRRPTLAVAGVDVVASLSEAMLRVADAPELMVIGGAQIFEQALPLATRILLTRIHADFDGDTFFPVLDPQAWREIEIEEHAPDEKNAWAYSFVTLERRG